MRYDIIAARRDEHLRIRFEEHSNSFPMVRNQARACAGRFEDARGWRKPISRHALAVNIQDCAWRAVESIVIARVNMPHITHVRSFWFVAPTVATNDKLLIRHPPGDFQKELLYSRLSIRKAISQETKVTFKTFVPRHRMMRVRIERVVNRHAIARPSGSIRSYHGISSTVGKDHVIFRDQSVERILRIVLDPVQRGW